MKILLNLLILICIPTAVISQHTGLRQHLRSFTTFDYTIKLLSPEGRQVKKSGNEALIYNREFYTGQKISFEGLKYMAVSIDKEPEAIIYFPSGRGEFEIPSYQEASKGPVQYSGRDHKISLRDVPFQELNTYRNLAFNPYDWQEEDATFFPHARSNSECRGEYRFCARNAINGLTKNNKHSNWEDRSWGPDKINDPWFEIDFGRLVETDKLVLYIRADFPHDGCWESAALAFDDGCEEKIKIKKTAKPQEYKFQPKKTQKLRIKNLSQSRPLEWCAFTEVEIWGKECFPFTIGESWYKTLRSINWQEGMDNNNAGYWHILHNSFPVEADWLLQDTEGDFISFAKSVTERSGWDEITRNVISQLSDSSLQNELTKELERKKTDLIQLYLKACKNRRREFLSLLEAKGKEYIFVKRYRFTPSFFAYTEGLSDARNEHSFTPGSALCKASLINDEIKITTLLEDKEGVIRDPDVSYDGKRILFAWKKSYDQDDYHLYEMNVEDNSIRQITFGPFHADFEGKYLPNGDIVFNSTRCEQTVDCWKTEVSNLFLVKDDGRFLRRIGFDQVQTTYPTVMENGKIIYTRWDYNDRGQTFPQPLFVMNPDGTAQTEFYGNNSWYPTTITHARQIPGTAKVMATLCGHHTWQHGKVGIIDPSKGRQENKGVQLISPLREEPPVRIDRYGQKGIQFQYPYPFSEEHFIVTADPLNKGRRSPFNLYFMDNNGRRELLARDEKLDCKQAVPLSPRKKPLIKPSLVDYTRNTGCYYVQNIYHGEAAKGIKEGTIEKLRVVAIEFRAAPVRGNQGSNNEGGVRVANLSSTPIALGQCAWDVKRVLGEVPVEKDGSAMFEVPAQTPVYFQLIDSAGYVAQTMRSWSTLQPGETFSCVGCHENKNESVPLVRKSIAMAKGVRKLRPFHNHPGGFSFRREIQPILNKHCISCHNNRHSKMLNNRNNSIADLTGIKPDSEKIKGNCNAFSLLDEPVKAYAAGREWNDAYLNLLQATYDTLQNERNRTFKGRFRSELVNWPGMQSVPTLLPPYYRGSSTSKLMRLLKNGHGGVNLSREEIELIACWIDLQVPYCGDYKEANIWTKEETDYYDYYLQKRIKNEEEVAENIRQLLRWKMEN